MIKFTSLASPRAAAIAALIASALATGLAGAANTIRVQSPDPTFGQCRAVELEQQGRPGESVLVCETVKPARKPGTTTVKHIGR